MTFDRVFRVPIEPMPSPRPQGVVMPGHNCRFPVTVTNLRHLQAMTRVHVSVREKARKKGQPSSKPTYKRWKENFFLAAFPYRPAHPLDGAVEVSVLFVLPRPGYMSKPKKRQSDSNVVDLCGGHDPGQSWHTSTPDSDNLAKSVLDALQHENATIWFSDDAQVSTGPMLKAYCSFGGDPHHVVRVRQRTESVADAAAAAGLTL